MSIQESYDAIMRSSIFRLDGPEIDLPEALISLGQAIEDEETSESTWSMGEMSECDLASLVIGSYWALTEWHGGQSSPEYAAMCALGSIFSPGMSQGPEEGSPEQIAYEMVGEWFQKRKDNQPNESHE